MSTSVSDRRTVRGRSGLRNPTGSYDVVIVGGRVGGAATALLLARRGHRVLVLDQEQPGRDTLSTHALMRTGVLQLQRWGLLDRVVAAGTPAVDRVTFHYGDQTVPIMLDEPLYAPRRTVLDPILVDAAREAGAEFRFGARTDRILWGSGGRVAGVAGAERGGTPFAARARVTVGADGRNSQIARAVRAPITRSAPTVGAVIYGYWSGLEHTGYEWGFRRERAAGLMPTNDGLTCVWASGPAATVIDRMHGDREAAIGELLAETTTDLARRVRAGTLRGVLRGAANLPPNLSRRPWGAGWALVGDAGYHKDPLTAHGISAALRDAELLADALDVHLTDPAGGTAALAAYERIRDELSRDLFASTAVLGTFGWDLAEAQRQHLILSRAMQREAQAVAAFGTHAVLAASA